MLQRKRKNIQIPTKTVYFYKWMSIFNKNTHSCQLVIYHIKVLLNEHLMLALMTNMFWLISYFRNHLRVLGGRTIARHSQRPAAPSLHFPSLSVKQEEIYLRYFSIIICAWEHECLGLFRDFASLCNSCLRHYEDLQTYTYIHIFSLVRYV